MSHDIPRQTIVRCLYTVDLEEFIGWWFRDKSTMRAKLEAKTRPKLLIRDVAEIKRRASIPTVTDAAVQQMKEVFSKYDRDGSVGSQGPSAQPSHSLAASSPAAPFSSAVVSRPCQTHSTCSSARLPLFSPKQSVRPSLATPLRLCRGWWRRRSSG